MGDKTPAKLTLSSDGLTAEQVSTFLLDNNYLLTALELLLESNEAGREADVELLATFFSDRTRFPPEALAKFEPSDAVDLQKLAKQREEELSAVRYELQIAKEDIDNVKAELAKAASGALSLQPAEVAAAVPVPGGGQADDFALSPQQRLALNAAVLQYLSHFGYDYTALTFRDEVGCELPAAAGGEGAPSLMHYLQAHQQQERAQELAKVAEQQLSAYEASQQRVNELEEQLGKVISDRNQLQADFEYLTSKVETLQSQQEELIAQAAQRAAASAVEAGPRLNGAGHEHSQSGAGQLQDGGGSGRLANDAKEDSPGPTQSSKVSSTSLPEVLQIVAASLPRVVPSTLVAKRDELLPLFFLGIAEHQDAGIRSMLASQLFTLVRKPTAEQCSMIAAAFVEAASRVGPARAAQELVPAVVSQVHSPHPERRMLVVEACGVLMPLVKAHTGAREACRAALQQLSTDLDPTVKLLAIQQLAARLQCMETLDAYPQMEDLLMRISSDPNSAVADALQSTLLPAVIRWLVAALPQQPPASSVSNPATADDSPLEATSGASQAAPQAPATAAASPEATGADAALLLYGSLLPRVMEALQGVLLRCPFASGTDQVLVQKGEAEQRAISDEVLGQVELFLHMYMQLLPPLRQVARCTMPPWAQQAADEAASNAASRGTVADGAVDSPHTGTQTAAQLVLSPSVGSLESQDGATDAEPLVLGNGIVHDEPAAVVSSSAGASADGATAKLPVESSDHAVQSAATDKSQASAAAVADVDVGTPVMDTQAEAQQEEADAALQPPGTPAGRDAEVSRALDGTEASSPGPGSVVAAGKGAAADSEAAAEAGDEEQSHEGSVAYNSRPASPTPAPLPDDLDAAEHGYRADGTHEAGTSGRQLSDEQLQAAFTAWVTHSQHDQWAVVEAVMQVVLPGLLATARGVPVTAAMGPLRRRLAQVVRSTAAMMGPFFTQGAIEPIFLASSTAPDYRLLDRDSDHVASLASPLVPLTWEGTRVGRIAVLPILMSSIVPCGPPGALSDFVRGLCGVGPGQTEVWALEYSQDLVDAVRFAATCDKGLQQELLRVMWELLVKEAVPARQCAAHMCRALAPVLSAKQVSKHLLPACVTLLGDAEAAVCELAVRCVVEVYGAFPSDAAIANRVQEQLEGVIPAGQHQVQLTALQSLTDGAPSYTAQQLEFMLKQVQWLVSTLHERSGSNVRGPSQLREMAGAILEALRVIDSCQLLDEALRLHHLTGLMALQHDKDLLDPVQRDLLAAMLRDRSNEAEEQQEQPPKAVAHRRTPSGGRPDGSMSNVLAVRNDGSTGRAPPSPKGAQGTPTGATTSIGRMASELLQKRGTLNTMAALSQSMRDPRRMSTMSSFLEKNLNLKRDSSHE